MASTPASGSYTPDPLGPDFEQRRLPQPPDYEGPVQAVLVRATAAPATGRAVLYVHGFNDYFFQTEMAAQYTAHGYRFYALDLRKYGRAILPHQHPNNVRSLTEYFADLDAALAVVRAEGGQQLVLSGHSTGGLIVSLYAAAHPNAVPALVLNSPFLELHQARIKRLGVPLLAALGRVWPNLPVPAGLSDTYGQSLHRAYRGHWDYNLAWKPNHVFGVNAGWLRAIRQGHAQVRAGLGIAAPVLVLHASRTAVGQQWSDDFQRADIVLNVAHIRHLAPRLGLNVTVQEIPDGIHDLFLSGPAARAQAYQTVFAWLAQVLPAPAGQQ
ncbi:alpha/beta hydrolase [Hymenobacter yonginensis]|uniref:Alpha/beta hydrolase n=1 Tax=Hymenobacter yonginensis TaxID=748197 RepID=A0ABY7PME3_9BACT|nr:alpha/beta hydrolase [Hymenobacter yonginensis]WBO83190.1 alpha/beta hydrolase [Hymenobacter yonginensis]